MSILVIEDNRSVAAAIGLMLERHTYAVDLVYDGESGLDHLLRYPYEAAIVDIGLPRRDGFALAAAARAQDVQVPLLILSARDAVEDRVRGLDAGADDYLVKPFAEEELIARLRSLLRRADRPLREMLDIGALHIDGSARQAIFNGKTLKLGATEFRMLEFFARNAGIVLTRDRLLERLWKYGFDGSSNIVDVYVSQLRRKIKNAGGDGLIHTIWGVGYKLDA